MPSILTQYENVDFIAARPFLYNGHEYSIGDDVPDAKSWGNLESLVRSRRLQPVIPENWEGKPFQFHREVLPRSLALRKLGLAEKPSDEAAKTSVEQPAEEYDPGEHSIPEVLDYVDEYPDELLSVYALEEQGKARSTLLKHLDDRLNKQVEEEENV